MHNGKGCQNGETQRPFWSLTGKIADAHTKTSKRFILQIFVVKHESLDSQYSELIKIKSCATVRQKIETKGRLDARELQGLCSLSTPNPTMLIRYLWSSPLTVIQEPYSIPAVGDPKRHDPLIIVLSSLCGEANNTRQLGNVHQ